MNGIYKIAPDQVSNVALRATKRNIIILIVTMITYILLTLQMMWKDEKTRASIPLVLCSPLFCLPIFGLILWFAFKNFVKHYNNPLIEINDNGIYKWNTGKTPNVFISWDQIIFVEEKKHTLLIKTAKASGWSGTGLINIPKELEDYDKVKNLIMLKANRI